MGEQQEFIPPNGENPSKSEMVALREREDLFQGADYIIGIVNDRTTQMVVGDNEFIVTADLGIKTIKDDREKINNNVVGLNEIVQPSDISTDKIYDSIKKMKDSVLSFGFGESKWVDELHGIFKEIRLSGKTEERNNLIESAKSVFEGNMNRLSNQHGAILGDHVSLGEQCTRNSRSIKENLDIFVANKGRKDVEKGPVANYVDRSIKFGSSISGLAIESVNYDQSYRETLSESKGSFNSVMDTLAGKK